KVSDAAPYLERLREHVEARDARGALARRHETRQDLHRRGLAGAVRAEKTDDLSLLDAERHVLDGRDRPVTLREMVDLDHRPFEIFGGVRVLLGDRRSV